MRKDELKIGQTYWVFVRKMEWVKARLVAVDESIKETNKLSYHSRVKTTYEFVTEKDCDGKKLRVRHGRGIRAEDPGIRREQHHAK